ncbi:MAG: hypothetical protein ACW96N_07320, partial [Candidatus Thorarchaeota archaeon]
MVKTNSRDYPVCVGENILPNIGESFSETTDRVFMVTDDAVPKIYRDSLTSGLGNSGIETITKVLPTGEDIKSLSTAEEM